MARTNAARGTSGRGAAASAAPAAGAAAPTPSATGARSRLRLGKPVGVKLFSGIAGVALRARGGVLPALLGATRAGCSRRCGSRSASSSRSGCSSLCELKAARRVSGHRQRARRRGDRDPVRDVLRRPRAVAPDPGRRRRSCCSRSSPRVAVLLSIRRESLFIAVLGLLGGFATPALLSTGENRPIPLFAYLLLLNIGLAWVAYRKVWPVLSWLTLVLTAIYQWGWVIKFLDRQPAVAGDGHLPGVPARDRRGAGARVARRHTGGSGSADPRAHGARRLGDAAALRRVSRGRAGVRRAAVAAASVPAACSTPDCWPWRSRGGSRSAARGRRRPRRCS